MGTKFTPIPTCTMLARLLRYDPLTGILYWRKRPGKSSSSWNTKHAGKPAGGLNNNGYVRLRHAGVAYLAHRLIWVMLYGQIPTGYEIDHKNGVRHDNRACNLRVCTSAQNKANRLARGYYYDASRNRYQVSVGKNKQRCFLRRYDTEAEAIAAYKMATAAYHGEYACHLSRPTNNTQL